jgi:hypothetical protein
VSVYMYVFSGHKKYSSGTLSSEHYSTNPGPDRVITLSLFS